MTYGTQPPITVNSDETPPQAGWKSTPPKTFPSTPNLAQHTTHPSGTNRITASPAANKRSKSRHTTEDPNCPHGNPRPTHHQTSPRPPPPCPRHPNRNKPHTRCPLTAQRQRYHHPTTPRKHLPLVHHHKPSLPRLHTNEATSTSTTASTAHSTSFIAAPSDTDCNTQHCTDSAQEASYQAISFTPSSTYKPPNAHPSALDTSTATSGIRHVPTHHRELPSATSSKLPSQPFSTTMIASTGDYPSSSDANTTSTSSTLT